MHLVLKYILRLTLVAAALTLVLVSSFIFFSNDMCSNEIYSELLAPNNEQKAVIFQRDCGATTGFSTQISIIKSDSPLANEKGNVFIIRGHPRDVAPILEWPDESTLKIDYQLTGDEYLANTKIGWFNKTSIKYRL